MPVPTQVHIISLAEICTGSRVVKRMILPKSTRSFLSQAHILKWSPETMLPSDEKHTNTTSEIIFATTWLMLSDGYRVIALSTELSNNRLVAEKDHAPEEGASNVLADFELGNQFGKITFADFVFSHRHVFLLFEMASQASIISLTKLQRDDIIGPKFSDLRSFSQSANGLYFSLLTRSKGQDQITIFSPSDNISNKAATFSPHTLDAQGMQWSPAGEPLLVVWDSASYGFRASFFTALGHHLRQLDLNAPAVQRGLESASVDDLGIFRLEWLRRIDRTVLAIAAGQRQVLLYEERSKSNVSISSILRSCI